MDDIEPPPCCDQMIILAECMQHKDGNGLDVLSMKLTDYLIYVAQIVCNHTHNLENQVVINAYTTSRLNGQQLQINILENAPPPTYPQIPSYCVKSAVNNPYPVDEVVMELEKQFCELRLTTGDPSQIMANVYKQPGGIANSNKLSGTGVLGDIPGWTNPVANMADSVGNLWLAYQDMYTAIRNIQLNCCPSGCDGIEINITASMNGNLLSIQVFGTLPLGFVECNPSGSQFIITDSMGNSKTVTFNITSYFNLPTGYIVDLGPGPVNPGSDLTISGTACVKNNTTGATCESCVSYFFANTSTCPAITFLNITETSIDYQFTSLNGIKTYTVEIWYSDLSGRIDAQTSTHSITETVSGTFTGLSAGTTYRIRLVIVSDGCSAETSCPFTVTTTNPLPCLAPDKANAIIQLVVL